MPWQKVALIGVGLLGGSLGLAVKQRALAAEVVGYVRRPESIPDCLKAGAVDSATTRLSEAVSGADLVIFCTPLSQMRQLAADAALHLRKDAIVTDVGSVKASVVQELEPIIRQAGGYFVGSHPMAGSEKTGVLASRADLFENATCVVTSGPRPSAAVKRVEEFWKSLGSRVMRLTPALHDEFVSRSSHLPHVVAAELANYVLSPIHAKEQSMLCATGFRDTTRIASGSPEMWRDISMANRENLARVLGVVIEDLQEFRHALDDGDARAVEEFFSTARKRREGWASGSASTSPE